jgi:putative transposase
VVRPNQVWSTDITYLRVAPSFAYLVVIIDCYSRKVLGWRLSNRIDAEFCVDCLEEIMRLHGMPAVFNSEQGSQFTSTAFTGVLKREGVNINMDGRGRALDNIVVERLSRTIKYEDIYLNGYSDIYSLTLGLTEYFSFYSLDRPHQSLASQTPASVYERAAGGGALILDKYPRTGDAQSRTTTGQRRPAAIETERIT